MPFDTGSITFRRFKVLGKSLSAQEVLELAEPHILQPSDIGLVEETECGWSGGEHVLDVKLDSGKNVFADCVHFALRVDTNKPPAELRKAYQKQEEAALAAGNPSGFISKLQKRQAKDTVAQKLTDERKTGKFHRTRLIPVLLDTARGLLYANASGKTFEFLDEIFQRSFDRKLLPLTSGNLATRRIEDLGRRRELEDIRPSRFAEGPDGAGDKPEYPWVVKTDRLDFLGNEFLLWLWHSTTVKSGIETSMGLVEVLFDRSLDLECAYGQTGKDSIRGSGPERSTEALSALAIGKVPRKAYLILAWKSEQYAFTLSSEAMAFGGTVLPELKDADTARVLFEERTSQLATFGELIEAMFNAFLDVRTSKGWPRQVEQIASWIRRWARTQNPDKRPAAIAS
ncbi:MAG: hypothetical protein JO353_07150 [Phycisphaerae bacterium]|nr:hypothetical protein [Phycisphaerae bacterium]